MSKPQTIVKEQLAAFGANLRHHRLRKGWTMDEVAERSGLSKPFLSRLESGDRQASIAAVLSLSQVFGVSLAEMFETRVPLEPCLIVRKSELEPKEAYGLRYLPLSRAGHMFNLRPIRVTVSLNRKGDEHYRHEGEEWIYVLSGEITLSLAGESYDLDEGDSIHFDSRLSHRVIPRSRKTPPEILLVASPLSLDRRAAAPTFSLGTTRRAIPALERGDTIQEISPPS